MPTGLEMLVSSIFKAAGVDAEKAKEDIANYGRQLGERIAALDASLVALRADQARVYDAVTALSERVETCYARPGAGASETQQTGVKRSTTAVETTNGEAKQHA